MEFVPGEKASRFIEILNNVKTDKKLLLEQPAKTIIPKKPTTGLQLNFKKMTDPEKVVTNAKQQNTQESDSFDSVEEEPAPKVKADQKSISFKDEQIVC